MIARNPHDPYIDAVFAALKQAGMEPSQCWTSDSETADDGMTCTLSAVLIWSSDDLPSFEFDDFLICWDVHKGWQSADVNPDGSNTWPEDLPIPVWAAPTAVVDCVESLLHHAEIRSSGETWRDDVVLAAVDEWLAS
jgi:hypothetical protein